MTSTQAMNKILLWILVCCLALASCKDKGAKTAEPQEDLKAKQMLQGIWVNEDNQSVAFRVKGDTIYYPDSISEPVYFQIVRDTFVLHGDNVVKYPILRQTAHLFVFRNQNGDEVELTLSEDADDASFFPNKAPRALNQNKLIKRDTVVAFRGERYHCYVQVNPTTYKVVKRTYNDEGVEVDNFYYDNIVNLHVYHGATKLFSSDFHKSDFKQKVPQDFLQQAVLSDLEFVGIDERGIRYAASLVIPDTMSSFQVEIIVSFAGKMTMQVV